ncbi:hypothetical protein RQP46_000295 [Phenoliferia psychrophenolica]
MLLSRLAFRHARLPPCTCQRLLSTSRANLAPFRLVRLPSRALLPIAGAESVKFLQGLVTNDVNRLGQPKDPVAAHGEPEIVRMLFAAVLKADGRLLNDIFLHLQEAGTTPAFLIEHDESQTEALRAYLKRHILRSKVKLAKQADADKAVFAAWRTEEESGEESLRSAEAWLLERKAAKDDRAPGMGWRWTGLKEGDAPPKELFEDATPAHYHLHRLLHAIPEGPEDWPQLPLEGNLDLMGAVDYRKGCYVGQELTARTHHKGVVRKRGVVLRLFREGEDVPDSILPAGLAVMPYPDLFPLPPSRSTLTPLTSTVARPRPAGKIGSSLPLVTKTGRSFALAFGSVKLEHFVDTAQVDSDAVFVVKAKIEDGGEVGMGMGESDEEGGRWLAKAFVPEWVTRRLEEEEAKKSR